MKLEGQCGGLLLRCNSCGINVQVFICSNIMTIAQLTKGERIQTCITMAYTASQFGVSHWNTSAYWYWAHNMPSSALSIYSKMGLSIDHDASPICCWRQILSREHFCNLTGATPFCAVESKSTTLTPQCHQALFPTWMKVAMGISTGNYNAYVEGCLLWVTSEWLVRMCTTMITSWLLVVHRSDEFTLSDCDIGSLLNSTGLQSHTGKYLIGKDPTGETSTHTHIQVHIHIHIIRSWAEDEFILSC